MCRRKAGLAEAIGVSAICQTECERVPSETETVCCEETSPLLSAMIEPPKLFREVAPEFRVDVSAEAVAVIAMPAGEGVMLCESVAAVELLR